MVLAGAAVACSPSGNPLARIDVVWPDASVDGDVPTGPEWCSLGSDVPGARLSAGLCMRRYATVPVARVLAVAPNGDLFVSSPSDPTPGGARGGRGAILVLSDDDQDGTAQVDTFLPGLPNVHGLAFGPGHLYFTVTNALLRVPYVRGQRAATAIPETVGTYPATPLGRWTHGAAVSRSGAVFTSQGVYSAQTCPDNARVGAVYELTGDLRATASGLRNPLFIRCHPTLEACFATELGDDGGASYGAREKLIAFRAANAVNHGFPCCATRDVSSPYNAGFDCAAVPAEPLSFPLTSTPFGFDWERGAWPLPYRNGFFVAMHGSFYSSPPWEGAAVSFAPVDPATGIPVSAPQPVIAGWDYGGGALDRPADVAFSDDGRLFVADDHGGNVYWVAPTGLRAPARR